MMSRQIIDRRTLIAAAAAIPLAACATARHAAPALRIVTYNIWHDAGDWPVRRPLLIETLRAADADVIVLQEVLQDVDRQLPNQGETIAAALGGGYAVFFSSGDSEDARRRGGNAILSRLPVIDRDWKRLDPIADNRTAQRVRIGLAGKPVDIVNTHLAWQPDAGAMRARQVDDLVGWLPGDRTPLVVAGDFNATADSAELGGVRARGLASALPPGAVATTFVDDPDYPPMAIDHIFFEPSRFTASAAGLIGDRPTGRLYPSDHFGVVATLRPAR